MAPRILSALLAFGFAHSAFAGFSNVGRGDQVCRIENGRPDECLPALVPQAGVSVDTFEIVDYLKLRRLYAPNSPLKLDAKDSLSLAASAVLSEDQVSYVLKNYERISARNLALVLDPAKSTGDVQKVRLLGSVYFKGNKINQFTVHVEGYLNLRGQNASEPPFDINNPESIREPLAKAIEIQSLSDSATELNIEALRGIETALRKRHFEIVNATVMTQAQVDAATVKEITGIVAPVIFARIIYEKLTKAVSQKPEQNRISNEPK